MQTCIYWRNIEVEKSLDTNFLKSFLTSSHSKSEGIPLSEPLRCIMHSISWMTNSFFSLWIFSCPQNSISQKSKLYKVNNHHRLVKDWIWIWLNVVGWCPGDVHRLDTRLWLRSRWVCLRIPCKQKEVQSSVSSEGWIISWNHQQSSASVKSRLVSESPVCLKLLH